MARNLGSDHPRVDTPRTTPSRKACDAPASVGDPRRYLAAVAAVATGPNPIRRESLNWAARLSARRFALRALRRFQNARTPVIVLAFAAGTARTRLISHERFFPPEENILALPYTSAPPSREIYAKG